MSISDYYPVSNPKEYYKHEVEVIFTFRKSMNGPVFNTNDWRSFRNKITNWCDENCKGNYRSDYKDLTTYKRTVVMSFNLKEDAALFAIFWQGINNE